MGKCHQCCNLKMLPVKFETEWTHEAQSVYKWKMKQNLLQSQVINQVNDTQEHYQCHRGCYIPCDTFPVKRLCKVVIYTHYDT